MSSQEEQLISFFVHSLFIYPVTNWLVSQPEKKVIVLQKKAAPAQAQGGAGDGTEVANTDEEDVPAIDSEATKRQERWRKWRGVILAIIFLITVSALHMAYDNLEKGPNAYSLLNMTRGSSSSLIRKTYRNLSRELHPDKNKSPTAAEEFQKVKQAYDVIIEPDLRRVYNILGDAGVKASAQTVIDHKYIMLQMAVYYGSTTIFAYLMTFSDETGDAFSLALFGLIFMLFAETCLVVEEFELPSWFLPYTTSHDIIVILHRIFPAFMNGGRSIMSVFSVNEKNTTVQAMQSMQQSVSYVGSKLCAVLLQINHSMSGAGRHGGGTGSGGGEHFGELEEGEDGEISIMARVEREQADIQENGLMAVRMGALCKQVKLQQQRGGGIYSYTTGAGGIGGMEGVGAEEEDVSTRIAQKAALLADPTALKAAQRRGQAPRQGQGQGLSGDSDGGFLLWVNSMFGDFLWIRNLLAYCAVHFLVRSFLPKHST